MFLLLLTLLAVSLAQLHCVGDCQQGDPESKMSKTMHHKEKFWTKCHEDHLCPKEYLASAGPTPCVKGSAGVYPCCNVDLLSFISIAGLGAKGDGNDIWGWTDPVTHHEIAIAGMYDGTSFVDVTDPTNPSVLGFLPTQTVSSFWRDIKVYKNTAYIVSEAKNHGLQVFDLTLLRGLPRVSALTNNGTFNAIPKLTPTAFYSEFGSAHNLVINEESGFLYSVGSKTCRAGLHMVDIRTPLSPTFAGCFQDDGYVHDAQCVTYSGPDSRYIGQEVCFCYDEDALTIVDVTVKSKPVIISRISYKGVQYTHQGWLLEGNEYLLLNDELDELQNANHHTRTMLWDVKDLRKPALHRDFYAKQQVIDHNLYTLNKRAYLSNYCGGLRILDTTEALKGGPLSEVAFFDVSPDCDTTQFLGSWSSYPYFPSGTIVVNSIDRGLFVLSYNRNGAPCS